MIDQSNINSVWGSLIIEELIRNGIDYFCISPGSRSAPLVAALAKNRKAKHNICYDERGASFLALGYACGAKKPAVLISTSGTAGANYFPAVIEASVNRVPLIILTADRPPELRKTASNQTINQVYLFGEYAKWHFDLPVPDTGINPRFVLTTIDQAVYQSTNSPAGPVHLNCMFREPLAPTDGMKIDNYLKPVHIWENRENPFTTYSVKISRVSEIVVRKVAGVIKNTEQGIVVIGRLKTEKEIESVKNIIRKLNWPVFPDINSGLRLGIKSDNVIPYYDQLLLDGDFQEQDKPETILHFGGTFVSKRVLAFLEKLQIDNYILIQNHPFRQDPVHSVTLRIESEIAVFCDELIPHINHREKTEWDINLWEKSKRIYTVLEKFVRDSKEISEISLPWCISQLVPEDHSLFLANSMPVRDMDMYGSVSGNPVQIFANRGASGIDGTLATAIGLCIGKNTAVTLIIGDLAIIHDLNSLSLIKACKKPVIIILINNKGGGIFSFLPIHQFEDIFEEFFGTPHDFTFRSVAEMFKIKYYQPQSLSQLEKQYSEALKSQDSVIIEVFTDREENVKMHKKIQSEIIKVLKN
jgi:2-succinyl-5-enolpyruvyl-6-hydroxy-3-cyclohexene-1-carboxylate synthase